MRIFLLIAAALLMTLPVRAGELLDQVVVTVNGNPLLQSDWDQEIRYEEFMADRPLGSSSQQDRESALNRLIDQELLREQMHGAEFKAVTADDIEQQLRLLQSQYAEQHANVTWSAALAKYKFSEAEIRNRIELELNQLHLIDERLRPSVEIDPSEVESYYKEKIAPKNSASQSVSFSEAQPKIRELLIQQKINQLLDSWLASLRTQAKIKRITSESSNAVSAK